jgi:hypothetical protein
MLSDISDAAGSQIVLRLTCQTLRSIRDVYPELWQYMMNASGRKDRFLFLECASHMRNRNALTCDSSRVTSALAASDEDNISLAGVGVIVFEKEKSVDAIIPQGRSLHDDAQRTS